MGMVQGCGSEQTPTHGKTTQDPDFTGRMQGWGNEWGPLLVLLVVPSLLQVCLTHFSCGKEGRGKLLGNKEEGKRRGCLPSFFEDKQIWVPFAAPPCTSCVIWGKSLSLSESQLLSHWVILEIRQGTVCENAWSGLAHGRCPEIVSSLPLLPSLAEPDERNEKYQPLDRHRGSKHSLWTCCPSSFLPSCGPSCSHQGFFCPPKGRHHKS